MNIRSIENLIDEVIERWFHQYPNDQDGIGEKLKVTRPKTKDQINEIIGNKSWTRMVCYECQEDVDLLLCFSQTAFDGDYVEVCESCVNKALGLIKTRTISID